MTTALVALVALVAAAAFLYAKRASLPAGALVAGAAARSFVVALAAAVGAVRSGAASAGRLALNVVRLALAWLIGFPAAALLCVAIVLLVVAVELVPKRQGA